jgi:hypothetical protein
MQALQGVAGQMRRRILRLCARLLQRLLSLPGDQIFLLGGYQLRALYFQQRLAAFYG